MIDLGFEHWQGKAAAVQHLGVEGADIEVFTQSVFGTFAQLLNFQRTDLVGKRL